MRKVSRREFIALAGLGGLAVCALGAWKWIPGKRRIAVAAVRGQDEKNYLAYFSPQDFFIEMVEIPFEPHSITQISETALAAIEKHGPRLLLFDFQSKTLSPSFYAPNGSVFNGHAAYVDGSLLVSLMSEKDAYNLRSNRSGALIAFDISKRSFSHSIDSHGFGPHDVVVRGSTAIVANSNSETGLSTLSAFDWKSGALIRRYVAPESHCFRHIFPGPADLVVALSETKNENHAGVSLGYVPSHDYGREEMEFFHFVKSADYQAPKIDHSTYQRIGDTAYLCIYQIDKIAKFDVKKRSIELLAVPMPQGLVTDGNGSFCVLTRGRALRQPGQQGAFSQQLAHNDRIQYFTGHTFQNY